MSHKISMEAFKEKNYGIRVKRVEEKLFFLLLGHFIIILKNDPKFKSSLRRKPEANSIKRVK